MDELEKFTGARLAGKDEFYSNLNMEDITDAECIYTNRVSKVFEIKNLVEYYDLHYKINTLFLADVFQNFRNLYLKIYHLYPVKFISATRLECQAALKTSKVKVQLLTDIDMVLMVEKVISRRICHVIHQYTKA